MQCNTYKDGLISLAHVFFNWPFTLMFHAYSLTDYHLKLTYWLKLVKIGNVRKNKTWARLISPSLWVLDQSCIIQEIHYLKITKISYGIFQLWLWYECASSLFLCLVQYSAWSTFLIPFLFFTRSAHFFSFSIYPSLTVRIWLY